MKYEIRRKRIRVRLLRDNFFTGVTQAYPRDALNRMLSMDVTKNGTTLEHEGYTFDAMNRFTVVNWANSHTDSFNYYQDGELNQAQYGNFNHTVNFNLDLAGNRTSVVDNNATTSYTPNTINQYTGVQGSAITNGNEHEISGFNSVIYHIINDGRLSSASNGTNTYTVAYDALGRCVTRTLNGNTTYCLYDGEKPVVEFDSTGAVSAQNLYGKGVDEILMRAVPANNWTLYYQQNHEGSVTLVTNGSGGVIERYRYDAFGAPTFYDGNWNQINYSTFNNRFLFTGREYAAATSVGYNAGFTFYEYRARAYHPGLGRFMSEDPKLFVRRASLTNPMAAPSNTDLLGQPRGKKMPGEWSFSSSPTEAELNLFRYCGNDPVDFTDPMGLDDLNVFPTNSVDAKIANGTPIYDKVFTVAGHGTQYRMEDSNRHDLSPQKLAQMIKDNSKYKPSMPVLMDVCKAGANTKDGSSNYAQRLADALGQGSKVIAPTSNVTFEQHGSETRVYINHNEGDYRTFTGNLIKSDTKAGEVNAAVEHTAPVPSPQ